MTRFLSLNTILTLPIPIQDEEEKLASISFHTSM